MTTKLIALSSLAALSITQMVSVFNDAVDAYSLEVATVKKFPDKKAAIARLEGLASKHELHLGQRDDGSFIMLSNAAAQALLEAGQEPEELAPVQETPAEVAADPLAAHTEANKQAAGTGKRGREAKHSGKFLVAAAQKPKDRRGQNTGSARAVLLAHIRNNPGMTGEEAAAMDSAALGALIRMEYVNIRSNQAEAQAEGARIQQEENAAAELAAQQAAAAATTQAAPTETVTTEGEVQATDEAETSTDGEVQATETVDAGETTEATVSVTE